MNKKALALVLALIISIPLTLVPMSGAFADSDIGISNSLLLSCFAWYTGTPGVDSSGIWYGSSFEEYSDSVESGVAGTTSFGVQCLLNTSGDYVDYQLNEYPFYANSWNSPILIVQLLLDRSSYGGPVEDLAYQFYTDTIDVIYEPFYKYIVPRFTLNNTDYVVMNLFFNIGVSVNSGHPHIKIMYDGTPANFIAMGMRFMGYRYSPEATLTTAELYQIQTDLITSFNMARLLDAIGSDDSDIDLSTIETALTSMDEKLSTIISNTDNIELLLNNVVDLENDILDIFLDSFNQQLTQYQPNRVALLINNQVSVNFTFNNNIKDLYIYIPYNGDGLYTFSIILGRPSDSFTVEYAFAGQFDSTISDLDYFDRFDFNSIDIPMYYFQRIDNNYLYYQSVFSIDCILDKGRISSGRYPYNIILHIVPNGSHAAIYNDSIRYSYKSANISFYDRVIYYLRSLLSFNSDNSVADDITQTSQEVSSNVQTVEQFETTYNTQLQDAHDDVDLSGYTISANSGMTYLKTYTHNAFTASNGLRVFVIYPIIFVLIGIFLRRFA